MSLSHQSQHRSQPFMIEQNVSTLCKDTLRGKGHQQISGLFKFFFKPLSVEISGIGGKSRESTHAIKTMGAKNSTFKDL